MSNVVVCLLGSFAFMAGTPPRATQLRAWVGSAWGRSSEGDWSSRSSHPFNFADPWLRREADDPKPFATSSSYFGANPTSNSFATYLNITSSPRITPNSASPTPSIHCRIRRDVAAGICTTPNLAVILPALSFPIAKSVDAQLPQGSRQDLHSRRSQPFVFFLPGILSGF